VEAALPRALLLVLPMLLPMLLLLLLLLLAAVVVVVVVRRNKAALCPQGPCPGVVTIDCYAYSEYGDQVPRPESRHETL
jgi:hypothetical protein